MEMDDVDDHEQDSCRICFEPLQHEPILGTACEHKYHIRCYVNYFADKVGRERCLHCDRNLTGYLDEAKHKLALYERVRIGMLSSLEKFDN